MAQRTSPKLMEFGDDSPRIAPPPPLPLSSTSLPTDATSCPASSSGTTHSKSMYFSDLRPYDVAPPPLITTASSTVAEPSMATALLPVPERATVRFFVSCTNVDGNLVASSSTRTAQTFVRGALNMFAQTAAGGNKTKSPRGKPPTDVNVEVRVSRELPLDASDNRTDTSFRSVTTDDARDDTSTSTAHTDALTPTSTAQTLGVESFWSERKKSRTPQFAVGFSIACQSPSAFDRHVQLLVMIPDDSQPHSNKHSHVFGVAQTSFHELLAVATTGRYQQTLTLPVLSPVADNASVTLRFVDVEPLVHVLFRPRNSLFRAFLFAPPAASTIDSEFQQQQQQQIDSVMAPVVSTVHVAAKLAIEEAVEVDYSVTLPLQLMSVCHSELLQMATEWTHRYNLNRKKRRHFDDDAEALAFQHDVFHVQVICGRHLTTSTSNADASASTNHRTTDQSMRPSTFSLAGRGGGGGGGGGGFMNRLKTQAGKWSGPTSSTNNATGDATTDSSSGGSSTIHPFVVIKFTDSAGHTNGPQEFTVGRTNTEYDAPHPVWSTNKSVAKCPHNKPSIKLHVSPLLPSRVVVSPINTLKEFVFYRPSGFVDKEELSGWLRFEVYHESYTYMTGVEAELIGEVVIPLQSVRDAMTRERTTVRSGHVDVHATALTLVDWFDVRSLATDECMGQIQLRLHIRLAHPIDPSAANSDASPADTKPLTHPSNSSSSTLENELPLEFLLPHVLTIQRHLVEVADMIRLSTSLLLQQQTFKSSLDKKRADVQSLATNLHVSYFRIYRNFASPTSLERSRSASTAADAAAAAAMRYVPPMLQVQPSTEDLLGLGDAAVDSRQSPASLSTPLSPSARATLSLEQRAVLPETHATITCGAPTAHAMGLTEYGLREMEHEIHRLQSILDKCTPRIMTTSVQNAAALVPEDAVDFLYSGISDDVDGDSSGNSSEGLDIVNPDGITDADADIAVVEAADSVTATPSASTDKRPAPLLAKKKYSMIAARAVAGAKAAKSRLPTAPKKTSSTKHKQQSSSSSSDDAAGASTTSKASEIKYPSLRTEAEDGIDPTTSINYAVRVLCRLEMLKTEYYLRKSVAVSQAVSGLVACFVAELELSLAEHNTSGLEQLSRIGFLIGWESLISSHGKELRMLSDAWVAIKCLETFAFQLVERTDDDDEENDNDVELEKRAHVGYTIRVFVPQAQFAALPLALQRGELIAITSVLFTQGINEMQSLANIVGHAGVSIQSKINQLSLKSIVEYYNRFTASSDAFASETSVGSHPNEILRNLRASVEKESATNKNTCILLHAADAVRSLHGGRVTYCKSGKDRTAMSVTLEQARLLVQRKRHVLDEIANGSSSSSDSSNSSGPLDEVKSVANTMRAFGVRIAIAQKNVGRPQYSFNSLQRKLLPEIYRPPMGTIQDIVTSVTARDS